MALRKEIFSLLDPAGRCPEKGSSHNRREEDKERKCGPERCLEAELARAGLGIPNPLVEAPGGHPPADRGEDEGSPFQQSGRGTGGGVIP